MKAFFHRAVQKLGLRQRSYQQTFLSEGSPAVFVLRDLALFCGAFDADLTAKDHDAVLIMHGRRQAFFRIFKHVKLTPAELELVCRDALVHAAARLQTTQGVEE